MISRENQILLAALVSSLLIHLCLLYLPHDSSQKEDHSAFAVPVSLVSLPDKQRMTSPQLLHIPKPIPSDFQLGDKLLTSTYKNTLIAKYIHFLREEIEKNKYSPPESRYYQLIGNIKLAFDIKSKGQFNHIRIIRSSGDALLDQTALNAIVITNGKYQRPQWAGYQPISVVFVLKYQYGL